jgi:hypothetical protein
MPVAVVLGDAIHLQDDAISSGILREVTHQVMKSIESQVIRARAIAGHSGTPKG